MKAPPRPARPSLVRRHPRGHTLALAGALLVALIGVAVLAISRLDSAVRSAAYFQSTGSEAPGLYGIVKAARGDPLYHDLSENPTTLLFGYAFYLSYGALARALDLQGAQVVAASKAATAAGAAALTVALLALTHRWRHHLPLASRLRVVAIALIVQLGPFLGWWPFTARPDVVAVGLELLGLVCFLRACVCRQSAARDWRIAIALWALAPTFKQTAVTMALGASLYLVTRRRWREALLIPAAIALTAAVIPALVWGRPYVMHAWAAPAVSPLTVHQALLVAGEALLAGAPVLVAAVVALGALKGSPTLAPLAAPLRVVLAVTLAAAAVLAARHGSSRNYYLPAFEVCALATIAALGDVHLSVRRSAVALQVLVALHGATAWAYVLAPGRVGARTLSTASPELRRMVESICAAPPPRFVEASYYALPHASCEYPAAVIDWTFYNDAPPGFPVFRVEDAIAARRYRSLFVQHDSRLHRLALQTGYRCRQPIAELTPCEPPA